MKKMYSAVVNSPKTELMTDITETDTEIEVTDASVLLQPEGLAVIGNGEGAETIQYASVEGNILKDCVRGFQGTAKPWGVGARLSRNFMAYDHDTFKENIEHHDVAIEALEYRLDTAESDPITLQPGLQVINSPRHSRFHLQGIQGRMLVNLLGRDGNMDTLSAWAAARVTLAQDTTNKVSGSNGLLLTVSGATTTSSYASYSNTSRIDANSGYYLFMAMIKNGTGPGARLDFSDTLGYAVSSQTITATDKFYPAYVLIDSSQMSVSSTNKAFRLTVALSGTAVDGQTAYFDNVSLYAIAEDMYQYLYGSDPYDVLSDYPYTEGIAGVKNQYAIRYGENLLPPFYEWIQDAGTDVSVFINDLYEATLTRTATTRYANINYTLPIDESLDYCISLSVDSNVDSSSFGYVQFTYYDSSGGSLGSPQTHLDYSSTNKQYHIVMTPLSGAKTVRIAFGISSPAVGTITFRNPMLVIGDEAKDFKFREDSMLALQTELFANPVDGSASDQVFYKDGQAFRLARWKKRPIDGSINFRSVVDKSISGITRISFDDANDYLNESTLNASFITKYDGKVLSESGLTITTLTKPDQFYFSVTDTYKRVYMAIPNADSGWGDAYTPTADEIKAYFLGWIMGQDASGFPLYNGTGTKAWAYRNSIGSPIGRTQTLPTTQAPDWTPYQLIYRLANPVIEPLVSEGALTLLEGENQVEVGTGIVLREKANPFYAANDNNWWINDGNAGNEGSRFTYKDSKILGIFRNNLRDFKWRTTTGGTIFGLEKGYISNANFDSAAAYSVTYLRLDKFPIQPISGTIAANEKAQLSDLTDGVQEAITRVSVLEQKKAEKDNVPVLFSPTLLNSWVNYGSTFAPVAYYKDSYGIVHMQGLLKDGGVYTAGTILFTLPVGFKPAQEQIFVVNGPSSNQFARLNITPTGNVTLQTTLSASGWLSLSGISFAAGY